MGKPRFGRSDKSRRNPGSLPSRKFTNDVGRRWIPRQRVRVGDELIGMRKINSRRQQRNGTDIGRADSLDNQKIDYGRLGPDLRIDVGYGTIRSAKINSDEEVTHTMNSDGPTVKQLYIGAATVGAVYDRAFFDPIQDASTPQGNTRGHRPRLQSSGSF